MSYRVNEELQWRDVPGFVGRYAISEQGDVWSLPRRKDNGHRWVGCLLAPAEQKHGYLRVNLIKDGKSYPKLVHRLVCRAFNGPAPEGKPWVLHSDGDTSNNNLRNLRWGSPKDNVADSIGHGTFRKKPKSDTCSRGHKRTAENTKSYRYGAYCRDCSKINHEEQRRKRLARGLEGNDPRHGTLAGYSNWGCRCEDCMEAKRLYQIERRARKAREHA